MPDSKLPGDTVFVCSMGLLYTGTTRVTPNAEGYAEGFSGVLRYGKQVTLEAVFSVLYFSKSQICNEHRRP